MSDAVSLAMIVIDLVDRGIKTQEIKTDITEMEQKGMTDREISDQLSQRMDDERQKAVAALESAPDAED
jgi:hypothetical protein